MAHDIVVLIGFLVGIVAAALSGYLIGGVLDRVEEMPAANRYFDGILTVGFAFIAGIVGWYFLSTAATCAVVILAICPGYFLMPFITTIAQDIPTGPDSCSSSEGSSWKGIVSLFGAVVGGIFSSVIAGKFGLAIGLAVAIVGSPILALAALGMSFVVHLSFVVIVCGGVRQIGNLLDSASRFIATARDGAKKNR